MTAYILPRALAGPAYPITIEIAKSMNPDVLSTADMTPL
jgi:hypothetical protein